MQRGADAHACGVCRSCLLIAAGSHPDLARIGFELRDDGKPRSEITIDQIRALSQRLSMSSQFGGLQIALIDPADRLNANAANALLKTLEEPTAASVIVLIADAPARLPATIRSRCQRIDIALPSRAQSLAWLQQQGIDGARAAGALDASLGNPGRARDWLGDDTLALRKACVEDLTALTRGRLTAAEVAERWTADRPDLRLWFAAALAGDEAARLGRAEPGMLGLTARSEIPKLAAWFARANRARGLLATPLRAELVLLDLLRAWPMGEPTAKRA
jgi:DNA polymerase-3 subunit delta'